MGMPKNLLLVRHGQSEGNLARKKFEKTQNESVFTEEFLNLHESQYTLTQLGQEQAKKAGVWLKENNFLTFDRMLVSNNVRAMQTAAHLDVDGAAWMVDFNLRERDGGLLYTLKPSEQNANYRKQRKFFDTQPFLFRPPQGESIADVCQRIKIVLDTLARECDGKDVIVVCHGHVIQSFMIILERLSLQKTNELILGKQPELKVPNCSITHYTRKSPGDEDLMGSVLSWRRVIFPAGPKDRVNTSFEPIVRKKFSNEDLLEEAELLRQ